MGLLADKTFVLLPTTDRYLSIAGEEWCRTLSISNNWLSLRVGLLVAIVPDGTNDLLSGTFQVGLCSGTTNTMRTATTTNAYFSMYGGQNQTLTYNAGAGNPYYTMAHNQSGVRVGTTTTLTSAQVADHYIASTTGSIQRRTPIYFDFDITAGGIQVWVWRTAAFVQQDYSLNQFLDGMQQAGTPTIGGNAMEDRGTGQIITQGAGILDTFSMYWNKVGFPIEIYAVSLYRQS